MILTEFDARMRSASLDCVIDYRILTMLVPQNYISESVNSSTHYNMKLQTMANTPYDEHITLKVFLKQSIDPIPNLIQSIFGLTYTNGGMQLYIIMNVYFLQHT